MNEDPDSPPIACTLTPEDEADRSDAVQRTLISNYLGAEERIEGFSFRFSGAGDSLLAVTRFVASELQCCSFANYTIEVTPPYAETRLIITGPEGTKTMFTALVDMLDIETA